MSVGMFKYEMDQIEEKARERALGEGKSREEAQAIGEKERLDSGSRVVTALSRSTSWALTGAAAGSVVPGVGTAVGGTVGFVAGAISALTDSKPSPGKAIASWLGVLGNK